MKTENGQQMLAVPCSPALPPQVELCAGKGNLSKGLRMTGLAGKEFDASRLDPVGFIIGSTCTLRSSTPRTTT